MTRLKLPVLLLLLAAVVLPTTAAAGSSRGARPRTVAADGLERRVAALVNDIRARHGLRSVVLHGELTKAARHHSGDMLRAGYFSHTSRTGESFDARIRRFHRASVVGENIAWATGSLGTPAGVVRMWMESPGHRAIILDRDFTRIGVGRAVGTFQGRAGASVWTADFAAR